MKMIYGLARVGEGSLEVLGLDVARHRREVKARLGVVPQDDNLDRDLTVGENLLVHAGYFAWPAPRPAPGATSCSKAAAVVANAAWLLAVTVALFLAVPARAIRRRLLA
jgi:ABC-type lipoprotein export system ATPase subunit